MKQLLTLLFALLLGLQQPFAQVSKKLEVFRENVLPEYKMYFPLAELTENGQLSLAAADTYTRLPVDAKKTIMVNITTAWRDSLVMVHYGSRREVWGRSVERGEVQLLDEYDLNSMPFVKKPGIDSRPHPWFFYFGGQLGGDSQDNINVALNLRLGFFLLKNRWDLATTFSGGLTANMKYVGMGTGTGSGWASAGLMSRVHFPIKNIGLSPNIGGELSLSLNGNTPVAVTGSIVLGVSWFIGIGNLDIGIHIGNIVSGSGGYTMSPKLKGVK